MGLWDFVKNAGKTLGIGAAEAAEPPAPTPEALKKEIDDLGLKSEGLEVKVEGDTVKVAGRAPSQEEREKIILAAGNVAGIAQVEDKIETPEPAAEPVFHTVAKNPKHGVNLETLITRGDGQFMVTNATDWSENDVVALMNTFDLFLTTSRGEGFGLTIAEAMHPLAFVAVGIYGKVLPNQNGAPLRTVLPWKYGFKCCKSIVRIHFTDRQPQTSWNMAAPQEYGFYSNVNPQVDHPRWSQASERRLGGGLFAARIPTQMFNGYADEVASLYTGLDLRKNY